MEIMPCRDGSAELWDITLMMAEYSMQPTLKMEWNTKARIFLLYYKTRYITRVKQIMWQTMRLNVVLGSQRGRVVSYRASHLKSGGPGSKSRSKHLLELFSVAPSSTPRLRL